MKKYVRAEFFGICYPLMIFKKLVYGDLCVSRRNMDF